MSGDHNQYQKDKSYLDEIDRYKQVRELVKDPSLRVTEIAWKTGYNKGHVSRLRKEAMRQELCRGEIMSENKTAKTPTDSATGFIDGVWYGPGPTAWQCQCGKPYTVTCISSKPSKQWVGLTDEEKIELWNKHENHWRFEDNLMAFTRAIEAKLKEKNHG